MRRLQGREEPDRVRHALRQEWELAIQRGNVSQLSPPAAGGAQGARPKAGKTLAQLAAEDDMVDL